MLTTRCPDCSTAFRVTPEQLKTRAGKVRCGHCNMVFNALETLVDAAPAPIPAEPAPRSAETEEPPAGIAGPDRETHSAEAAPPVPGEEGEGESETIRAESVDIPTAGIPKEPASPPRWRPFAWGMVSLLALGLLLIQAAYFFRAELAVSEPDMRPFLEALCEMLDCDIPLPRKAELVGIEASDLHPDPQRMPLLVLSATLKNRAPFIQDYPHLELTLTDTLDQPLLRRVLAPPDYLVQGTDARAGFAANGELTLTLWLDATETGASGYRLYLFYP